MNLLTLDLNLLKVFDALYRERHVGRAAERIGLAQPSMSNALSRLRHQFQDPLFQRMPDGMQPTELAEQVAPGIQTALQVLSEALEAPVFDPKHAQGEIVIAASDLMVLHVAPSLTRHLAECAPAIDLHFVPLDKRQIVAQLDDQSVTLALGTFSKLPARFHRREVLQEAFVCIARSDHPGVGETLDVDTFIACPHALMTLKGDRRGAVDDALRKLGKSRRIAMTCVNFSLLPELIAQTDLLATVPSTLSSMAERAGCRVHTPPITLPIWSIDGVWSQQTQASAFGQFAVSCLKHVAVREPREKRN